MKKLLYTLALVLPIVVLGQSTDQNYIKSTTYKKALKEQSGQVLNPNGGAPITVDGIETATDTDKIEQVTYYDGLGRPMQTNAYKAGGIKAPINELTYDWKSGNLTTGFFNKIGADSENLIVEGQTPFGVTDLLWRCGNDATSDADGGWNTDQFTIDNTKKYRYTTWVKRTGDITNGYTYHGTQNVNNLDGTPNGNPYFWSSKLPQANTWYLLVGIVHPHSYTGANSGESGVYDVSGNKISNGQDYKWKPTSTTSYFRNYLYYCTDTTARQYFYKPLLQKTSGEDWTVPNIITNLNANDIVTHIAYDAIGRQSKTYLPYATTGAGSLNYRSDALTNTNTYYKTKYASDIDSNTPNPFSEIEYEASPLNRVLQQGAPGKDWSLNSGHTVKFDYQTNKVNEVKNYGVNFPGLNNIEYPVLVLHGTYNPNELYKTSTKDENWVLADGLNRTTEEFKDKQGRVILKRTYNNGIKHDTQYVYDAYGNLTYVLSPKGTDIVATKNQLSDFSNSIPGASFTPPNTFLFPAPTGVTTINLVGKTLTLNVNIQFPSPQQVKTGAVYQLSGAVPNVNFNTSSSLNGYSFTIENGYLTVGYPTVQLASITSLNGTFTVELPEYEIHQNVLNDLCYQYKYDYRNRLVEKKIPGKGWEYIVYDKLDRPRLTQDANLASTNNWLFTKYDAFGRAAYTGKIVYVSPLYITGSALRKELQGNIDAFSVLNESRVGSHTLGSDPFFEYTNVSYPIAGNNSVLTVNYYDSYPKEAGIIFGGKVPTGAYNILTGGIQEVVYNTKSLATASKVRVIATDDWILSATYYNKKARPLFIASKNDYLKTIDYVTNEVDFMGNITATQSEHLKEGQPTTIITDGFTYDHQNRLVKQIQEINSGGWETIVNNEYDALGQLVKRDVGNSSSNPLQRVNYSYNVRGWLKQINDVTNLNNDLFSFKLNYSTVEGGLSTTTPKLYNGNISQTIWNTANDSEQKSYAYIYDGLNRINEAHTRKGSLLNSNMMLDLSGVNYDKNGNILNLDRNNLTEAIDDLDYVYDGNQLIKVTDLISANSEGFKDGVNTTNDYIYDTNGNMKSDANKQITSILYNHLNLPTEVKFENLNTKKINYTYDATGVKLKKVVTNGSTITTTDYAGNYVYTNNVLQFFFHPEGYVEPTENPARPFQYVYQFKDHLGNIRLSYRDKTGDYEVLDDSDFTGNVPNGWVGAYSTSVVTVENERLKHEYTGSAGGVYKDFVGINGADNKIKIGFDADTGADTNSMLMTILEYDANYSQLDYEQVYDIPTGYYTKDYVTQNTNTAIVRVIIRKNNATVGTPDYFYVDNIHITSGELEIMETKDYYPFGMRIRYDINSPLSAITSTNPALKYGFNGKEMNDDLGLNMYDYGARFYQPDTGRWFTPDALAEMYYSDSTYGYALNSPIMYIDPDGNQVEMCCDGLKGFVAGMVDNVTGYTNLRTKWNNGSSQFRTGVAQANGTSLALAVVAMGNGAGMTAAGTGLLTVSGVTAATGVGAPLGGAGAGVSGAAIGLGVTQVAAGGFLAKNTVDNMSNGSTSNSRSSSSTRSQPKKNGEPSSSEVQARDVNGKVTKYTEFDKSGKFKKEYRAGDGTAKHGIEGPTVKTPKVHTNPKTGETFNNGFKVSPAKPIETPK